MVNGQNSEEMCQGGKPGTGKLYTDVCLCCSAHTSGCVVDGLGATAAFYYYVAASTRYTGSMTYKYALTEHTKSTAEKQQQLHLE